MATLVCHTSGCANADLPLEMDLWAPDVDGVMTHADTVVCGACGEVITDISNDNPPEQADQ